MYKLNFGIILDSGTQIMHKIRKINIIVMKQSNPFPPRQFNTAVPVSRAANICAVFIVPEFSKRWPTQHFFGLTTRSLIIVYNDHFVIIKLLLVSALLRASLSRAGLL
jgi:hypothetical protein